MCTYSITKQTTVPMMSCQSDVVLRIDDACRTIDVDDRRLVRLGVGVKSAVTRRLCSTCRTDSATVHIPEHASLTQTTTTTTKTFITRKFAEAANARSVDSTEEKRLQSLFEDIQRDVR